MARYRHYDPQQTKMIAVSYARQLLPGTFEHALSYLIDNEIDLGRFAERFKNDETGAPAYDPAVLLKLVLFAWLGFVQRTCLAVRYLSIAAARRRCQYWQPAAHVGLVSMANCMVGQGAMNFIMPGG
ncbi:MAG: hypothetical protein IPP82_01855 [Xanthomonadales bacterium]|nr:hypothetical protein [Xanthomonadales bacterium]